MPCAASAKRSTVEAHGKKANSSAPRVIYVSPLAAFSIVIISAAVVDKFLRYTYDLVKLAADANTADEVEVATWNCVAPPAIAKESVTDKFKASEAEISVLANVNVGVSVAMFKVLYFV